MSRNRLTGDALTTTLLPAAAGTFNEGLTDDVLVVPSTAAAGAHIVTLNGSIAGQAVPGDGDQITIVDPFGVLASGTTLQIKGKISSLGAQIANNTAAADSVTLNTAGAGLSLTYSSAAGVWVAGQ